MADETGIVNNFDNTYQHLTMNTMGGTLTEGTVVKQTNENRNESGTLDDNDGTDKMGGSNDAELQFKKNSNRQNTNDEEGKIDVRRIKYERQDSMAESEMYNECDFASAPINARSALRGNDGLQKRYANF
eukprot:CAMPEP_0116870946 /NCGR_PEP_ID=MMETSP0463-20121206/1082_1 /TAXON_ID=181622 /ORGANISM="Strombidinopsis sp, Strain SopsisLIS2011" /LENGTH=129 /DNA_ID=CAMNT_0004508447 /DNA_START=2127 /DNA_END=2516 /DNA_ORIENTATION=-